MRQCYLILFGMFASLPAMAMTFQTRLENIEWKVEGDKFECRLIQPITDFGSGAFVRRAGEQAVFRLNAYNSVLGERAASLQQPTKQAPCLSLRTIKEYLSAPWL